MTRFDKPILPFEARRFRPDLPTGWLNEIEPALSAGGPSYAASRGRERRRDAQAGASSRHGRERLSNKAH